MAARTISVQELRDSSNKFQIIDVRSYQEFEEGHIPGAVNIPMEQIQLRTKDLLPDRQSVFVCQSGKRAAKCAREGDFILEGGTAAWIKEDLPVVSSRKSALPIMRQVQIAAGLMIFLGALFALIAHPLWVLLPLFVGGGLIFAGVTGYCGLAAILLRLPWNRTGTDSCAHASGAASQCHNKEA